MPNSSFVRQAANAVKKTVSRQQSRTVVAGLTEEVSCRRCEWSRNFDDLELYGLVWLSHTFMQANDASLKAAVNLRTSAMATCARCIKLSMQVRCENQKNDDGGPPLLDLGACA